MTILGLGLWAALDQKDNARQEKISTQAQTLELKKPETATEAAISRYERDREDQRSAERERIYFFGGIAALFFITGFFPRFGTFILGPGVLIATAWFIFGDKGVGKFLFSSGGDGWTGLGKLIIWIGAFLAFSLGVGIIAFGRARLRAKEDEDYAGR